MLLVSPIAVTSHNNSLVTHVPSQIHFPLHSHNQIQQVTLTNHGSMTDGGTVTHNAIDINTTEDKVTEVVQTPIQVWLYCPARPWGTVWFISTVGAEGTGCSYGFHHPPAAGRRRIHLKFAWKKSPGTESPQGSAQC